MARPSSAARDLTAGVVTLLTAVVVALQFLLTPVAAVAQETERTIVFDSVTLDSPRPADEPLRQWDLLTLQAEWNAPHGVEQGQEFSLTFPDSFQFIRDAEFSLVSTEGVSGGSCVASGQRINCIFSDGFANRDNISGTLDAEIQITGVTEQRSISLTTDSGIIIPVDLPGTGVVVPEVVVAPTSVNKSGWVLSGAANTHAQWRISVNGAELAGHTGELVVADEILNSEADTRDMSYVRSGEGTPFVTAYDVETVGGVEVLGDEIYPPLTLQTTYSISPSDNPSMTVTLTEPAGGWDPGQVYIVDYQTETSDGLPFMVDERIINRATVLGESSEALVTQEEIVTGGIEGTERGAFELTKLLDDPDNLIPDDTEFSVQVDIDSPVDSFDSSETWTLTVGELEQWAVPLPRGTQVTLSEPTFPEIDGVTFGAPRFAATGARAGAVTVSPDGTSATFKTFVIDNVELTLTNSIVSQTPPVTRTCVEGSSVSNPLLWLIPLGALTMIGAAVAPQVMPQINRLIGEANAQLARSTPDLGSGVAGMRDPDWAAQLTAQIDSLNQQFARIDPYATQTVLGALLVAAGLAATTVTTDSCDPVTDEETVTTSSLSS